MIWVIVWMPTTAFNQQLEVARMPSSWLIDICILGCGFHSRLNNDWIVIFSKIHHRFDDWWISFTTYSRLDNDLSSQNPIQAWNHPIIHDLITTYSRLADWCLSMRDENQSFKWWTKTNFAARQAEQNWHFLWAKTEVIAPHSLAQNALTKAWWAALGATPLHCVS